MMEKKASEICGLPVGDLMNLVRETERKTAETIRRLVYRHSYDSTDPLGRPQLLVDKNLFDCVIEFFAPVYDEDESEYDEDESEDES